MGGQWLIHHAVHSRSGRGPDIRCGATSALERLHHEVRVAHVRCWSLERRRCDPGYRDRFPPSFGGSGSASFQLMYGAGVNNSGSILTPADATKSATIQLCILLTVQLIANPLGRIHSTGMVWTSNAIPSLQPFTQTISNINTTAANTFDLSCQLTNCGLNIDQAVIEYLAVPT
ncbi:MAG: hypothetical protein K2W96_18165 [Gemmataceae bacterium]|nr:hypothetical protein [Gemmataceae bacterium]